MAKPKKEKLKYIEYGAESKDRPYNTWTSDPCWTIQDLVRLARVGGNRIVVFNRNDIPMAYISPAGRIRQLAISINYTKASEILTS